MPHSPNTTLSGNLCTWQKGCASGTTRIHELSSDSDKSKVRSWKEEQMCDITADWWDASSAWTPSSLFFSVCPLTNCNFDLRHLLYIHYQHFLSVLPQNTSEPPSSSSSENSSSSPVSFSSIVQQRKYSRLSVLHTSKPSRFLLFKGLSTRPRYISNSLTQNISLLSF